MTKEWAELKAACLLSRTSINACAKKFRKHPKALYRALNEPNFSKGLRAKLLSFTEKALAQHQPHLRRARAA